MLQERRKERTVKFKKSTVLTLRFSNFQTPPSYKNRFSDDSILCVFFASSSLFIFSTGISIAPQTTNDDEQTVRLPFSASCSSVYLDLQLPF
jgi:hypothetical protein